MKKAVTGIAVLAGVAAVTAYALKKNEQKKIRELDEELLYDEPQPSEPTKIDSIQLDDEEEEGSEESEADEPDAARRKDDTYKNLTAAAVAHISKEHERLAEELKNEGDHHEVDRPIQHLVYFTTQEDADAFKKAVVNKGFVVSAGENEFDLIVLHISPIDQIKLVTNELYLADQAYAHHGEYKGWHARVSY